MSTEEKVDHPAHYGGADNPYEAIKVIEAWKLGFNLGNAVKLIARAELKGAPLEDLKKALWYLVREIGNRSKVNVFAKELKCHLKLADAFGACGAAAGHSSTNPRDVTCPACLAILFPASDHPKTARPSPNHTRYEHGSIWPSQRAWEFDMTRQRNASDSLGLPVVEEIARIDHMTWLTFNK